MLGCSDAPDAASDSMDAIAGTSAPASSGAGGDGAGAAAVGGGGQGGDGAGAEGSGGDGIGGIGGTVGCEDGYYDMLVARPELHHHVSLCSQQEIDDNLHGQIQDPREVVYDDTQGAARMQISSGSGSVAQQMRIEFNRVSSGTLLFYWEGRWEQGFVSSGDIDGLQTNKAYQLARRGSGDNRRVEPRTRFSQANPPFVAKADTRIYHFTPAVGDQSPLEPQQSEFNFAAEAWTRFWALVDFDNNTYSYWIADETRAPVVINDAVGLSYDNFPNGNEGLDWFWFEHNSSQSRTPGTPLLYIWGRHFAVLRDVADASALVAAYSP